MKLQHLIRVPPRRRTDHEQMMRDGGNLFVPTALRNAGVAADRKTLLSAGASFCRMSFAAPCRVVSSQHPIGGPMLGARRLTCTFMLAALLLPLVVAAPLAAQSWPTRPVKFILTLGPGSGADIGARL